MAEFIEKEKLVAGLDKTLKNIPSFPSDPIGRELVALGIETVIKTVKALPAADVRPVVRATWIVKEMQALFPGMDEHPVFVCSECGYQIYDLLDSVKERHHFCPNCGADMRETNDEKA